MLYIQNNVVMTKCCTLLSQQRINNNCVFDILYSIVSTTVTWGLYIVYFSSTHQSNVAISAALLNVRGEKLAGYTNYTEGSASGIYRRESEDQQEGVEGQVHEQMDGGEGGMAVSDPIPTRRLEQEEEEEGECMHEAYAVYTK